MLNSNQLLYRENQLRTLLPKLERGEIECIEYGPPDLADRSGFYSRIRIRFIPTAGGPQFGIRLLSNGIEGSGIYYPTGDAAFGYAWKQMLDYHRPSPLREKLEEFRRKHSLPERTAFAEDSNEWFATGTDPGRYHRAAVDSVQDFLPDATVINL